MNGEERRKRLLAILEEAAVPVSGTELSRQLHVSRQVIVQDIALLRANGESILSTHQGYYNQKPQLHKRVFKVLHTEEEVETEMNTIVDLGAAIEDVFVYHKVYGVVRAELKIRSRRDVRQYLRELEGGKSTLLMKVTSGYHYHTVSAEQEEILDALQERLAELGFLAPATEYEPEEVR